MGSQRPRAVVLDAGALIQFERGDRRMRTLALVAARSRDVLLVPAGALAEAWRDGSRQARLGRLIASEVTRVIPLDELAAKAAGILCGRAGTSDVVDASIALAARAHRAAVVTTDPEDIRHLDPTLDIRAL